MKQFMAIYVGSPAAMSKWDKLSEADRKERQATGMKAWQDWMAKNRASVIENGGPLGKTKRADAKGITDVRNNLAAYVIVQAESQEAAAKMFLNHRIHGLPRRSGGGDGVPTYRRLALSRRLFVAQRADRIQVRGLRGGQDAETYADRSRESKRERDGPPRRMRGRKVRNQRCGERAESVADRETGDAAEQAEHERLEQELQQDVDARFAPIALRMPISRVRSVTDTSMMFMIPMPPTSSEMLSDARHHDRDGRRDRIEGRPGALGQVADRKSSSARS